MTKLNRLLPWPLVLLLLFLLSATALAAAEPGTPPTPDTDVAGWLTSLAEALASKEWTPAIGLAFLGITYAARMWLGGLVPWFKTTLGGIVLAYVVTLTGTVGVTLAAHQHLTLAILLSALTTSSASGLFWEWLKKLNAPKVPAA